jgi:hypothetical protein
MLSTKTTYKCPVCGEEVKASYKDKAPVCYKDKVRMVVVKQGIMTK